MNKTYTYRIEEEKDYAETENLTREAFWDLYKPGCDEHFILHNMRTDPSFIRDLAFVCVEPSNGLGKDRGDTDRIVGAIYCTECRIVDGPVEYSLICIGPIGVLPECQRQGIGLKLLSLAHARARELGYCGSVLFGNPAYYRKSGFTAAARFGIHMPDGNDMPEFMCCPLDPVLFASIKGVLRMNPVFLVDEKDLAEYEKRFPAKEKHSRESQIFRKAEGERQ